MKQILGIDVGGTKIAAGLVDSKLKVSQLKIFKTPKDNLIGLIKEIIFSYSEFEAVGIGLPGYILPNGTVAHLPNISHFQKINVKKYLEKEFKVPVNVANDARSFSLAEAIVGAGKNYKVVVGVILGTGVGSGIVMNKKIYLGKNFLAGEIGHFFLPGGKTFEQYVRSGGKFKQAKDAREYLEILLSVIIRSIDPDIIIFGGGWSNLSGMQKVLTEAVKKVQKPSPKTIVKVSRLNHAGIIGAVLPLLQR